MSARQSHPVLRGRNQRGSRQRGRGGRTSTQRRDESQLPDEPKQLIDYSTQDWDRLITKTGVLRGWQKKGTMARSQAVALDPKAYGHFYQTQNKFSGHVLGQSRGLERITKQVKSKDEGLDLSAGGGAGAAQVSAGASVCQKTSAGHASNEAAASTHDSHGGSFVGATMWLHPDNLVLSDECKKFFDRDWDTKPRNQTSIPGSSQQSAKIMDEASQRALLKEFEDRFGSTFHQTIQLGASRENISASERHDGSRQLEHSRSRQIAGHLTVEAPGAQVKPGAHYNLTNNSAATESGSSHEQDSTWRSHGGAASLAHSDETAWRQSHSDAQRWSILEDLSNDSISLLHLVHKMAGAQRKSGSPQIVKILKISRILLGLLSYDSAALACQDTLTVYATRERLVKGIRHVTFKVRANRHIKAVKWRLPDSFPQSLSKFVDSRTLTGDHYIIETMDYMTKSDLMIFLTPGWRCQLGQGNTPAVWRYPWGREVPQIEREPSRRRAEIYSPVILIAQEEDSQSKSFGRPGCPNEAAFFPILDALGRPPRTDSPISCEILIFNPELYEQLRMAQFDDEVQSLTL